MISTYDLNLVILSVAIAILAAYTALDLASQVTATKGIARIGWIVGGGISMGIGIWSMHFIGMLAFELPVAISYDPFIVLISMLPAIFASGFSLFIVSRQTLEMVRLFGSSIVMGSGIAAMHYTGMAAMRLGAIAHYNFWVVAVSVMIGIAASFLALWLAFSLRNITTKISQWQKLGGALLMGIAVPAMHYTGMMAVSYTPNFIYPSYATFDPNWLATVISIVTFTILGASLLLSLEAKAIARTVTLEIQAIAMDAASDGIAILRDHKYIYLNPMYAKILGYHSPNELIGQSWHLLYSPEQVAWLEQKIFPILQQQGGWRGEITAKRKDGNTLTQEVSLTFTKAGDLICVCRDISLRKKSELEIQELNKNLELKVQERTAELIRLVQQLEAEISDRKATEIALRQSEQRYQTLAETSPCGVFYNDPQGNFIYTNERLRQIVELTPEESLNQAAWDRVLHPEDRDRVYQQWHQAAAAKRLFKEEYRFVRSDGKIIWVIGQSLPVLNEQGEVIGNVGTVTDITYFKTAEQKLQASQAELLALFNAMQDVIIVLDREGRYLKIAPTSAPLLYKPSEELMGRTLHEIFPTNLADLFLGCIQEALNTQETVKVEYSLPVGEREIWFDARVAALSENTVIWVARNMSDRKAAEQALRQSEIELRQKALDLETTLKQLQRTQSQLIQSEKMSSLGQLVAGVAHEINNPVNFIYGNLSHANDYAQDLIELLELYQRYCSPPHPEIQQKRDAIDLEFLIEDFPKLFHSMQAGTERIQKIVLSLRNFSRIDEAERKAVNIHDGIDSTLAILQNRLKAKSDRPEIQIVKNYSALPQVECYAGQLNQVFMNLLANAIDALEEDWNQGRKFSPLITISSSLTTNTVIINIADNGSGIPTSVQPRLFDPFFTTKPVGKGTGLGLSISYQIVTEKHGGELQCISTPAQGTQFLIKIPVRQ